MIYSRITLLLALTQGAAIAATAQTVVEDWQFNTLDDFEGWTVSYAVQNEGVRPAITGSEIVLSGYSGSIADLKVEYPPDIAAPANIDAWETLEFRFRQLDGDPTVGGTAPQTFVEDSGQIILINYGSGYVGYGAIPSTTQGNFTIVTSAEDWMTVTVDLTQGGTNFQNTDITQIRLDLVHAIETGFELDYVTLTASTIPEPSTVALFLGLAVTGVCLIKRRNRRSK